MLPGYLLKSVRFLLFLPELIGPTPLFLYPPQQFKSPTIITVCLVICTGSKALVIIPPFPWRVFDKFVIVVGIFSFMGGIVIFLSHLVQSCGCVGDIKCSQFLLTHSKPDLKNSKLPVLHLTYIFKFFCFVMEDKIVSFKDSRNTKHTRLE